MRSAFFKRIRPEQVREIALLIIIVAVVLFFATQVPDFASGRTFTRVATTVPITVVLGVGLTLVILYAGSAYVLFFVGTFGFCTAITAWFGRTAAATGASLAGKLERGLSRSREDKP